MKVLIGNILSPGYDMLFGWWLTVLVLKSGDRALGRQLAEEMADLFARHSLRVVENAPSEYGAGRLTGAAIATVVGPEVKLQFLTGRGDLTVYSAPVDGRRGWSGLISGLPTPAQNGVPAFERGLTMDDLPALAAYLETHWSRVVAMTNSST